MKKTIVITVGLLLLALLVLFSTTYTVRFNEVAIKTRFGKIDDNSVKREPGVHLRFPIFADRVTKYDTRLQLMETPLVEASTADGQSVVVRAFLMWQVDVDNVLTFYQSFPSTADLDRVLNETLQTALKGSIESEDVVQETFVRAFEVIQEFEWRGNGSFSAWLRGIARNIVVDAIRKKRPSHGLQVVERTPAEEVSPSKTARRDERFNRLKRALEGLQPDHRAVLMLSRIEGLPIREVAARMKRSPNAVKQLLSRALKALRSSFGDTESLHLPDRRIGGEGTHDAD